MKEPDIKSDKSPEKKLVLEGNLNGYEQFFDSFSEICAYMGIILSIDKIAAFFVNKLSELLNVKRISFMLLDKVKGELSIKASRGLDPTMGQERVKLGEAFSGWVAKEGNPLIVKDVGEEFPELAKNRAARYLTKSFIIVPVKVRDGILGVLSLTDKKDESVFTDDDLKKLTLMSSFLALHIQNIKLLEEADNFSISDPLTSLLNHRYFMEQLLEEIYRAERYKRPLSLIMFDIDNFAQYNQACGYAAGDNALKQIAKIIKENTRKADMLCRYGPEEFMAALPETRLKDAAFVGEKVRERISESIFTEEKKSAYDMARLTVSVGVAEHRVGLRKEELIQRVSEALLEAKHKGKNCLSVYK